MYSQNHEEEYILEAVKGMYGQFLDIGAYDGVRYSNTFALTERNWFGVLVEPSPAPFLELQKNYAGMLGSVLVHALIATDNGWQMFWTCKDLYSTTVAKNVDKWKRHTEFDAQPLWMPCVGIKDFIGFMALDDAIVVSIDTEGTSAELFSAFPFRICHPKVFCVEHDGKIDSITECGAIHGYGVVYQSNENLVLVKQ